VVKLKVMQVNTECKTRKTPLDIHHPAFRQGYWDGRRQQFRKRRILTDKHFVELLLYMVQEGRQGDAKKWEQGVYYTIGSLVGQMSTRLLPRQPHEEKAQDVQEAFLLKVAQRYGEAGKDLVETIRQFWAIHDQLAQRLGADTFVQMLCRGA
jgi:hypothetical protein